MVRPPLFIILCLQAWLGCWAASKTCPKKCKCSRGKGKGDCGVQVTCRGLAAFPDASEYPEKTDCVFIHSPKLGALDSAAKERGLQAIPSAVRRLDLSECSLGELPETGFGHLRKLRVLNLEFNRLRRLPPTVFEGLSLLKVLWLTGNHYQPGEKGYKQMKKAGNRIEALHPAQFHGLENLQVLLLHHNALKTLHEGVFAGLNKLRVMKLIDNPWTEPLYRDHPAFDELLDKGDDSVLQQLDLEEDTGDSLEDYWEETRTYLSDDFSAGLLPDPREEL